MAYLLGCRLHVCSYLGNKGVETLVGHGAQIKMASTSLQDSWMVCFQPCPSLSSDEKTSNRLSNTAESLKLHKGLRSHFQRSCDRVF